MQAHSMVVATDGSGLITNTNLPGFVKSTDPSVSETLPCPAEWGNGTQVRRHHNL